MPNNSKLTDEQVLLEQILAIRKTLDQAPVLNGAFQRLTVNVEAIKEKQDTICKKVDDISSALYEPDEGLYSRIKELEFTGKEMRKDLQNHFQSDEKMNEQISTILEEAKVKEKVIGELEEVTDRLKSITGGNANLDKLNNIMELQKSLNKAYWLMFGAILTTAAKFIFDVFMRT